MPCLRQKHAAQQSFWSAAKNDILVFSHFQHRHCSGNVADIHLNISSIKTCQVLHHSVQFSAAFPAIVLLFRLPTYLHIRWGRAS